MNLMRSFSLSFFGFASTAFGFSYMPSKVFTMLFLQFSQNLPVLIGAPHFSQWNTTPDSFEN